MFSSHSTQGRLEKRHPTATSTPDGSAHKNTSLVAPGATARFNPAGD
jgi:hypothetical protein